MSGAELGRESQASLVPDFAGDRRRAFWHLSLGLAKQADELHAALFARQPQFVTFADPRKEQPVFVGHDLRLRLQPHWIGPDTFRVAGTFLDKAPDKYPAVSGPIGHADGPVCFRVFAGTVEQTAADAFCVGLDGRGKPRAEILAFHPGDATYRYPLATEARLIREGKMLEANGLTDKDPIACRPGLGRLGAPCVLRFTPSLERLADAIQFQRGVGAEGGPTLIPRGRIRPRPLLRQSPPA